MSYERITCPYCFEEFDHREVHFRADGVNPPGLCPAIPGDYDDLDHFLAAYNGSDKEEILQKVEEWTFFQPGKDEKYEKFWEGYGGTTEYNPADDRLGVLSYLRPVIDPNNSNDQRFLRKQSVDGYLIYDQDGFAEGIQSISGNATTRRVCPHCHNPLPMGYGKNPVRFVSVIGITASGKTVYLSQLLKNLDIFAEKAGQAVKTTKEASNFLTKNPVAVDTPLPGSTPPESFQQPLFYDFIQFNGVRKEVNTFVLYDIAGEDCVDPELISKFGKFIEHSDGVFLMIDPMQFRSITGLLDGGNEASEPNMVLKGIHDIIMGKASQRCDIPIAVCISKSDMPQVHAILDPQLDNLMNQRIEGMRDRLGHSLSCFNSAVYNPIGKGLRNFVLRNEPTLEQMLYTNYSRYNYFAFSSLGCAVKKSVEAGVDVPVGPIIPSRIEEPLLWLWHEFGYIDADPPVIQCGLDSELFCPRCNTLGELLPPNERQRVEKNGLFRRVTIIDNYKCPNCGNRW